MWRRRFCSSVSSRNIDLYSDHILPSLEQLDYKNMDKGKIALHLDAINWRVFFHECADVDSMYLKFVECCQWLIMSFTPRCENACHTRRLRECIARLEALCASQSPPRRQSSLATKLSKAVHRLKVLTESTLDFKDSRAFYSYANSRLRRIDALPLLKSGPSTAKTDIEKADLLGAHFGTLFCSSAGNGVSTSNRSPPVPPDAAEHAAIRHPDTPVTFSEQLIFDLLGRLKPKCSNTPAGLPPIFYKNFALFLAEPLRLIFERSYSDGIVPDVFKQSIVTPIHKKGQKTSVENYRPVSQGSIACGVFEKILVSHITKFLMNNNLTESAMRSCSRKCPARVFTRTACDGSGHIYRIVFTV